VEKADAGDVRNRIRQSAKEVRSGAPARKGRYRRMVKGQSVGVSGICVGRGDIWKKTLFIIFFFKFREGLFQDVLDADFATRRPRFARIEHKDDNLDNFT
jgi:hypothetical protein